MLFIYKRSPLADSAKLALVKIIFHVISGFRDYRKEKIEQTKVRSLYSEQVEPDPCAKYHAFTLSHFRGKLKRLCVLLDWN